MFWRRESQLVSNHSKKMGRGSGISKGCTALRITIGKLEKKERKKKVRSGVWGKTGPLLANQGAQYISEGRRVAIEIKRTKARGEKNTEKGETKLNGRADQGLMYHNQRNRRRKTGWGPANPEQ